MSDEEGWTTLTMDGYCTLCRAGLRAGDRVLWLPGSTFVILCPTCVKQQRALRNQVDAGDRERRVRREG